MDGSYTVRDAAGLLGLPVGRVRSLARAAGLAEQGKLGFQDLVVLRSLARLVAAEVPARQVRRALERSRGVDAAGQAAARVSQLRPAADGVVVVVRDAAGLEEAASGQRRLDFAPPPPPEQVATVTELRRPPPAKALPAGEPAETAEAWYERGCELEESDVAAARACYLRAIELDGGHADALINLGRLCHESGELPAAERHYQGALAARPLDPLALFNLGVVLEDLGRFSEAAATYRRAIAADPGCADAHFNLSRLCEQDGDRLGALRHLSRYRQLTRSR